MADTTRLLESSFVDAVVAIGQATDLSEQSRRHWVCSLRQIAKWLDRPRSVARTWNACAGAIDGWPARRLIEPPIKAKAGPGWEEFPEGLRSDLDAYLRGLCKTRLGLNGKRIAPCQPATIHTRRAELVAVARMARRRQCSGTGHHIPHFRPAGRLDPGH